jgi:hypothetical protein
MTTQKTNGPLKTPSISKDKLQSRLILVTLLLTAVLFNGVNYLGNMDFD